MFRWITFLLLITASAYGNEVLEAGHSPGKWTHDYQAALTTLKGKSSKEIWQKIEGLIFQHWCKKKNLENMPMHEAMMKLKADSEAGPFILKLEQGLHSKSLKNEQEVTDLIQNLLYLR